MKVSELFNNGKLTEATSNAYGAWIDTKRNNAVHPIDTELQGHAQFIYDNPELFGITPDMFEDELMYDQDIYLWAFKRGWVRVIYPDKWDPAGLVMNISASTEQNVKKAWPKIRPHTTHRRLQILIEFYPTKRSRTFILPQDRGKMIEFFTM